MPIILNEGGTAPNLRPELHSSLSPARDAVHIKPCHRATPYDRAHDVTLQPDGKIVVVGEATSVDAAHLHFGLVRYNVDGTLDTRFGGCPGALALA